MNLLGDAFNIILYQPLLNVLVLLYEYLPGHDFGIAVIVLTVLIRLILYPLMAQSIKSQKAMSGLQPKIQEIQKKFKDDREKQTKEMIELYRKEKINPFGGFLPLLIQLPVLIALYRVFWRGFQPEEMASLYSFIPHPGGINPTFLGLVNLSQASIFLAILAGITQFFQSRTMTPKTQEPKQKDQMAQFSKIIQKQMLYFFPIFTVFILLKLPAAIAIYWIVTSLFSIVQQCNISKNHAKSK
ncbi:MAG: YidC/Oxa1 family membrane protein insertase [Candidatus Paceibacterales bacterium]